jgi:hypothetical protein
MQTPSDGNRRNHCSRRFQHPAAMRLTFTWHRSPRAATKHRGISRRPLRRHLLTAPPRPAASAAAAGRPEPAVACGGAYAGRWRREPMTRNRPATKSPSV